MNCYTYNGVTFSEEELFNKIKSELANNEDLKKLAAVVYKLDNPKQILDTLKIEGEEAQVRQKNTSEDEHPYIAATKFITARHLALNNGQLTPEIRDEAREANFIQLHKDDPTFAGDENAMRESFREQLANEKLNNSIGSYIHGFVNILLTKGKGSVEYKTALQELENALKTDNYRLVNIITENDKNLKSLSEEAKFKKAQESILDTAEEMASWVKREFGECEIYSEIPMLLKNSSSTYLTCDTGKGMRNYEGILGIADLIILDKSGKIHIVDYKVCSRPYIEWYNAKLNEVEYQLAIYRAILTQAGFNGDDIDLQIKPVLFEKQNISSLKIQPTVRVSDDSASRVSWRYGKFTQMLRRLGIGTQIIHMTANDSDLEKAINNDRMNIIGIYEDPKILTKQFFIDHDKIEPDKDANGKIIGYKFWSRLQGTSGGYLRAKTIEEFTRDGGILDQYIKDLEQSRNDIAKNIINEIQSFKDEKYKGIESGKKSFLRSDKNVVRKELLQKFLGKYTNSEWECLSDQLPAELLDRGILVFQKVDCQTGEHILDVVILAEGPLTQNVLINGNQTVLGKYKTDEEVKQLNIVPLRSQYRNVKAIEAIAALNTIINHNPDILNQASLGNVVVLNPNGQASDQIGINISQLLDNFDIICSKENGNIDNSLRKMRIPTTYEYCMSELQTVLTSLGEDSDLGELLHDIDNGTETLRLKKQTVSRLLTELRNHYPQVRKFGLEGNDHIDMNDPAQVCYIILAQMNNYLHGIHIDFDGRIPRWGISLNEMFSLLGVPFLGKQAQTDTTGVNIVGLGNGMELSSPRTTRSNTLRQLNAYYDVVYNNVRKQFMQQTNFVMNLTKDYANKFGSVSLLNSDTSKVWERLLVHDGDKLNPQMIVKNPYDNSNDLTSIDREFLKQWLWEVNKYLITDPSLDESWHYKDHEQEITQSDAFKDLASENDGKYFQLPLARANSFQRISHLKDFGIKNWFDAKWKDFEETYDPRALHNERRKQIKKNDVVEMYNVYTLNAADRKALLDSVNTPYEFSLDFDFLALDVAFNTIRKRHFDNALMLTETVLTLMQYEQQTTDANLEDEKEVARTQVKILKGESAIPEEVEKIAKPIGIVREINSFAMLAARPMAFLKELVFGMFTNFSRAWALKYGSNGVKMESMLKASTIVWGQRGKKYANALFGESSLADFQLCEQINRLYGIANEDLMKTSVNASMSRIGVLNNSSRWMYIAQTAPDYYNRMTLFIAKMIEDGCFEAHTLEKDGTLKYDWKKDKRFSELAKHGLNSDYSSPEYNKQKALYAKMCSELERGDADLIKWNEEKRRYEYGDIDQAYTPDQKASIKEVADTAYGFYDHESKSQINHKFLGLMFLQFQTFLSAKYNLWLKGSTTKGRNTAQGRFVEMERNGVKYYDKHIIDPNTGKLLGVKATAETELTEEEKRTLLPTMEWQGDFVEGLFYSIGYTLHDIFTLNWKEIANNKQRLANVMLAMHDIIIGILLFWILKFIFSGGSNKMSDVTPLKRVFLRGMQDVGPEALTQVSITPSFVQTWSNLKSDGIKLLSGSENAVDQLTKHFGATRDFIWNEN